ncbi:hypothetical protein [Arthrobacter sp. 2MCAF14]|uniref:hypothetical protein n=1 Tax=Arthrobacter sp. 2MCAF14 TaxID=3232982 RepID=UPI003F8FB74D
MLFLSNWEGTYVRLFPTSTEEVKHELEKLRRQAQREVLEAQAEKLETQELLSIAQAEIQAYDFALQEHPVRNLLESPRRAAGVQVEESRRRMAAPEQS